MAAFLRFYLRLEDVSWSYAADLSAKASGYGKNMSEKIRKWTRAFILTGELPINLYRRFKRSLIHDEDFAAAIHGKIRELKKEYFGAEDVLSILQTPEI